MLIHWLWFSRIPEQFRREKMALMERFDDPEEIYYAGGRALNGLPEKLRAYLDEKDLTVSRKILEDCTAKDIRILPYGDGAYPAGLKSIFDPPAVLYCRGTLPDWSAAPVIGVVGTRKASAYGLRMAMLMGAQIAAGGGLIVSGCADGIDRAAMEGALAQGKPVVGVLGNGVDVVYPRSSRELYRRVEQSGCLLSEYPPGTSPTRWTFPRRNRIISGMSSGTLVVEAPRSSGALITARDAWEQGRDVFAVPGNADNPVCEGSNGLLRERAIPALCGWDVLKEYDSLYPGKLFPVEQVAEIPREEIPDPRPAEKKTIDKEEKSRYIDLDRATAHLTPQERAVTACLTEEPVNVDEVITAVEIPASEVLRILTRLTVKGIVKKHPGNRVSLNYG